MLPENELSSQAYITGFSYPVKSPSPADKLQDWELAGIGLNDASAGLLYQLWHGFLQVDHLGHGKVYIEAPNTPATLMFEGDGITEIDISFDQNMNPVVGYMQAGSMKLWWFDPSVSAMVHTTFDAGSYDPRLALDEKRLFNIAESDVVFSYLRAGNLYVRYQRDRYLIEYLLKAGVGANCTIVSMAMNRGNRFQWRLRNYELTDDSNALVQVEPYLGDIVLDLCRLAGIKPEHVDVSELYEPEHRVHGIAVDTDSGLDETIKQLQEVFQFDKTEPGYVLKFIRRGRPVVARIPFNLLVDDYPKTLKRTERDRAKLPRVVNINHIDPDGGFAPNKQSAFRRTNVAIGDSTKNIDTKVVLSADQAATAAWRKLKTIHNEYEDFEFSTRLQFTHLTVGDVVEVEDADGTWYRVHLTERNEDDGNIRWEAETDAGYLIYDNVPAPDGSIGALPPVTGNPLDPPVSTTPGNIGDTELSILNWPVQRDQDDELGLYIAARGAGKGWTGYTLSYSLDAGVTYTDAYVSERIANIGETVTAVDADDTSVEVLVPYPLESVSAAQIAAGENRAAIGDEEVQYKTATLLGMVDDMYHYSLTGLVRNVLHTPAEPWGAGIRFVPFDDQIMFLQLQREFYGQDIWYKATSIGQPTDEVIPVAYLFDEAVSQTEWPVTALAITPAPGGFNITWQGSPRLSTFGSSPYHSKYMRGYRVKIAGEADVDVTSPDYFYATTAPGNAVTVQVCTLNTITGEGPAVSVTGDAPGWVSGDGTTSGTMVNGYAGIFWTNCTALGDPWDDGGNEGYGRFITGDWWPGATLNTRGYISEGVYATEVCGVPQVAGTYAVDAVIDLGGGPVSNAYSVTIAPTPAYSVLDFRRRPSWVAVRHTGTGEPFSGVELKWAGIVDYFGWTAGLRYCEIEVVSASYGGYIGVHGASLDNLVIGDDAADTLGYWVDTPGVYGLVFKTATGELWVRDAGGYIGGGDPVAGTLPTKSGLLASTNGRFRFGAYSQGDSLVLKTNFGNTAWAYALPSGATGVDSFVESTPCVWDINTVSTGGNHVIACDVLTGVSETATNLLSNDGSALGTVGKSAGKYQFNGYAPKRFVTKDAFIGLAQAGYTVTDGLLGTAVNTIGIHNVMGDGNQVTIRTNFGTTAETLHAVAGEVEWFTIAQDHTAGTVSIYADGALLRVITGVPAATWFPAYSGQYGTMSRMRTKSIINPVSGYAELMS